MPLVACSMLCNKNLVWAGIFARSARWFTLHDDTVYKLANFTFQINKKKKKSIFQRQTLAAVVQCDWDAHFTAGVKFNAEDENVDNYRFNDRKKKRQPKDIRILLTAGIHRPLKMMNSSTCVYCLAEAGQDILKKWKQLKEKLCQLWKMCNKKDVLNVVLKQLFQNFLQ